MCTNNETLGPGPFSGENNVILLIPKYTPLFAQKKKKKYTPLLLTRDCGILELKTKSTATKMCIIFCTTFFFV